MPPFSAAVTELGGTVRGYPDFQNLKLTRRLGPSGGGNTISFDCDALSSAIADAEVASRAIKLYDGSSLRFYGKIDDPLVDTPSLVQVVAKDFGWLDHRREQGTAGGPTVYTATGAGAIVTDLLARQNARGETRLRMGTVASSVNRDRTYDPGKVVSEAILELAKVDDGFYFRVDPVDGVAAKHAEIVVLYPASGADKPGVKFEFGDDTIGNLETFTRTRKRPLNVATATGQALRSTRSDAASIAAYDLIEDEVAYSDVVVQQTLDENAQSLLRPAINSVYSFTPLSKGDGAGEINVPRLFVDFDVGDIVRLSVEYGRIADFNLKARVLEATIAVADEAQAEQLVGISFEIVP
jgi:hypothetical protein